MKITLAQLRTEAVRAFGPGTEAAVSSVAADCFVIAPRGWYNHRKICVWGSSRMGARRLAYDLLRRLPDAETP